MMIYKYINHIEILKIAKQIRNIKMDISISTQLPDENRIHPLKTEIESQSSIMTPLSNRK